MYNSNHAVIAGGAVVGGGLAATGLDIMWVIMAAFAVIAVGVALLRIVPKRKKK